MANRYENIYANLDSLALEIQEKYKYGNKSSAFGHIFIKMKFGLTDDEIFELNTDGKDDNGIDAIYIDNDEEQCIHFFQFKFPNSKETISNGVGQEDVDPLLVGFDHFVSPEEVFNELKWNEILKDKRKEFTAQDIYNYKIWIVKFSTSTVNQKIINRLDSAKNKYVKSTGNYLEVNILTAPEISLMYENIIKNKWCDFKLHYKKSLNPFSDGISSVYSGYIPLNEIYNSFYKIKDKIFEGNVRYLNPKSKINNGIKETLNTEEKKYFHLLNNGITIFCKKCKDNAANEYFDIKNGSIINGAQTVGTIINYLNTLDEETRKSYESQYVYTRIIQMEGEETILDRMVYTLNTQNEMKSSYSISNEVGLKILKKDIDERTKYFLELKNNEYNFFKENNPDTKKMLKDKIDIETLIQAVTAYYDIEGMATSVKNNKATLFEKNKIDSIIDKLEFNDSIYIYEKYLYIMDIVSSYRSYRKNSSNKAILSKLNISENEIDDYRFLNTGNFFILYGVGCFNKILKQKCNDSDIVDIIKMSKDLFANEINLSQSTRTRIKFDQLKKLIIDIKKSNDLQEKTE